MSEYLQPAWQRISTNLVAVIWWGIALLIWYFPIRNKNKKILEFIELNKWEVVDVKNKWFKETLEISYWDKKVSKLSTYTFRLKNIWNKVINKEDFIDEEWIELFLNKNDEKLSLNIIWVEVTDTSSSLLEKSLELNYFLHWFWIKPFVLNPWEYFTIRVVVDWEISSWYLETRIKETELLKTNFRAKLLLTSVFAYLVLVIVFILQLINKYILWKILPDPANYANDFLRFTILILPWISFYLMIYVIVLVIKMKWLKKIKEKISFKNLLKKFWW